MAEGKRTNNGFIDVLNRLVGFGIDMSLPYLEMRKARLMNVIVFSITFILLFFMVLNIIIGNYFLAISDVVMFFIVCLPSLYLQYKRFYKANLILITSAFFVFTTILTILKYDYSRQTEHILIPLAIMPIFLFDGWRKNLMFSFFVISFFAVKVIIMIRDLGSLEIKTIHIIYAITFLIVYVLASYFKSDMIRFYNMLSESNKTKDKLFRIISHDIRNPFSSLLGSSDLQMKYLKTGDTDKLEKTSLIINSASKKIYELTQTLLDWSQTQTETFVVKLENTNITDLVKQVADFCSITSRTKEIEIVFKPVETMFNQCDNIMTQIAVRNIIMNAIKFSHRNSEIFLEVYKLDGFVNIKISDKGVGMSQDRLSTLFDGNTISSDYGTEKEKGTGLGLIISKELIEKQGGNIKVNSTEGKGSEFVLSLPHIS
ncbi:MAG: HAMP domain-containing sensor histidine kinase [Bacteroidales bacterium]|nr:HAMP domain-containing sensor histidine kinase [Bacteroidales bacterium]